MTPRLACVLLLATMATARAQQSSIAQQSIGTLRTDDASIAGLVTVSNGRAMLGNSGAVTAGTQTAEVALARGGAVRVCAGSTLHLSQSNAQTTKPALLLALDRGAVEIRTAAERTDVVLTPDLRFELSGAAPLDLRIRVVANGDTCVENAGKDAPMLHVTETFGTATYFIRPGQHVLFEHGNLREVVDRETSSCGCPRPDTLVLAGKGPKGDGKITDAVRANPFPEAVSQGLQQPVVPQSTPGEVHVQVASTLRYDGTTNTASGPPDTSLTATPADPAPAPGATPATAAATTKAAIVSNLPPQQGPHPLRAIGRFFRRIFGVPSAD